MAFPKKGLRKINIDGHDYFWIASGNDGYIDLIICLANGIGQKLFANFDYHSFEIPTENYSKQRFSITPHIVRQVIEYGLKHGWTPEKKSADLRLGPLDEKIDIKLNSDTLKFK